MKSQQKMKSETEGATQAPPEQDVLSKMKIAVQGLAELLRELNAIDGKIECHQRLAKDARTAWDAYILSGDLDDLGKINELSTRLSQATAAEGRAELLTTGARAEAEEKLSAQNDIAHSAVSRVLMAIHEAHIDRAAKIFLEQDLVDSLPEARAKASEAKAPMEAARRSIMFGQYRPPMSSSDPAQLADEILIWAKGAETELRELTAATQNR